MSCRIRPTSAAVPFGGLRLRTDGEGTCDAHRSGCVSPAFEVELVELFRVGLDQLHQMGDDLLGALPAGDDVAVHLDDDVVLANMDLLDLLDASLADDDVVEPLASHGGVDGRVGPQPYAGFTIDSHAVDVEFSCFCLVQGSAFCWVCLGRVLWGL